ncbi:aldo/keto reductase family protein [Ruminococcus sp.]|uniref:aldo/keto reductase family protein n=1 Tax=Ruminococcus sp. TaxID=41978 RepID=UPI003AB37016
MGLDYLDQMIIHSPQPWTEFRVEKRYFEENKEVWRALEDAQAAGKVRVIGVSNFLSDDLESLLSDCRVKPAVNQILLHISNTDTALVDYCKEQNIQVEAYSPIAHGEALKNPAIAKMAEKYGVFAAQLCIRYVIQLGTVALPKTADPDHMKSNAHVDFVISDEDMKLLTNVEHISDYGDFNMFPVFSGKPLA